MIAIIISLPWATQRITQILKNYDQTSKRSNSGSRRALEELKKGKAAVAGVWESLTKSLHTRVSESSLRLALDMRILIRISASKTNPI